MDYFCHNNAANQDQCYYSECRRFIGSVREGSVGSVEPIDFETPYKCTHKFYGKTYLKQVGQDFHTQIPLNPFLPPPLIKSYKKSAFTIVPGSLQLRIVVIQQEPLKQKTNHSHTRAMHWKRGSGKWTALQSYSTFLEMLPVSLIFAKDLQRNLSLFPPNETK